MNELTMHAIHPTIHTTNIFCFIFVYIIPYVIIHKNTKNTSNHKVVYTKMLLNNKVYLSSKNLFLEFSCSIL